jgi:hypothetical protein
MVHGYKKKTGRISISIPVPQFLDFIQPKPAVHRTRVIYALAGGERGHEKKCGSSPCLQGQKAWRGVIKSEYHRRLAIGGTKHGGDTGY